MGYPAEITLNTKQAGDCEKFETTLNSLNLSNLSIDSDGTAYISCRNNDVQEILDAVAIAGIAAGGDVKYPTGEAMSEAIEIEQAASGEFLAITHTAAELAQSEIWDAVIIMLNEGATIDELIAHAVSQRISTKFNPLY